MITTTLTETSEFTLAVTDEEQRVLLDGAIVGVILAPENYSIENTASITLARDADDVIVELHGYNYRITGGSYVIAPPLSPINETNYDLTEEQWNRAINAVNVLPEMTITEGVAGVDTVYRLQIPRGKTIDYVIYAKTPCVDGEWSVSAWSLLGTDLTFIIPVEVGNKFKVFLKPDTI